MRLVAGPAGPYQEKPEIWILCERFLFSILAQMKKIKKNNEKKRKKHMGHGEHVPIGVQDLGLRGPDLPVSQVGKLRSRERKGLKLHDGPQGKG